MDKTQIAEAVAKNARCTYNECSYRVYGYQRVHVPGGSTDESILLITEDSRTLVYANMPGVILESEEK